MKDFLADMRIGILLFFKEKVKENCIMKKWAVVLMMACIMGICGCAQSQDEVQTTEEPAETVTVEETAEETSEEVTEDVAEEPAEEEISYDTFALTSENLVDGVWDMKVVNTDGGENLSPQLSWEPVEGATCYAVYMLDLDAYNWMHMKYTTTNNYLELGEDGLYIGPCPPSDTHQYVLYVVALKEGVEKLPGRMASGGVDDIYSYMQQIDVTMSGETGNVISYGELSGTYTKK